ncbi:putative leader peptide [Streptomyces sp. NPDC006516]
MLASLSPVLAEAPPGILVLFSRRHIDLRRVSSAACPATGPASPALC